MGESNAVIKVVIGKTSLDGHWRGVQAVATALRNAGMEVIYAGSVAADAVVKIALDEDADVIGLNVGASYQQVQELMDELGKRDMRDVLVILGGVIPPVDVPKLKEMGVDEVFPPGSRLDDIVGYVRENARAARLRS